jgi:adenine-specific DNA-methyltransferase
MSERKEIKISAAKGRPMLSWVGKRPLRHVTAFPAQHIETFAPVEKTSEVSKTSEVWKEWPAAYPHGGLLFHGDNKEVLAHLLANGFRGKVKLIYIDPPFDSGADYVRKVQLRGGAATVKIEGESYNLGEQIQYTDIWANDNYLQFMYERLQLLKELLADDGSIYLHCDWSKGHMLRCLLDEVFGSENCQNEIVWKRTSARSDSTTYNHIHDLIYFYSKSSRPFFIQNFLQHTIEYTDRYFSYTESDGRRYATIDATQSGLRNGPTGQIWRGFNPSSKGNHWKVTPENLDKIDAQGRIYWPTKDGGWPRLKQYLDEVKGTAIQSLWTDLKAVNSQAEEREDYPTQKPHALLERIISCSTAPGDLILDCFIGSGTTAVVAQKLGRRWIGCDINKGAIQTTAKRLQSIIEEQVKKTAQKKLITTAESSPEPAQLSFGVWRVNDYDLKIQRNEAIKLACEHIGVERIASEGYFDGKLGKKLVKIIPFEHPLSPLDLEELKRELDARLELENTIVFVCLGIELVARTWIEDWNRLRKGEHTVNKIEVIELRTDAKYGNFIKHEPAAAKVSIIREGDKIKVRIEDFISPTILKRLDMDLPLFKAKITDWRSQVDCVMIDTAYNGEVFNVTLSNVPEKKNDLIEGSYSLPSPAEVATVAVKIIDMLGEEVLFTERV